jgi:hypothetical protein
VREIASKSCWRRPRLEYGWASNEGCEDKNLSRNEKIGRVEGGLESFIYAMLSKFNSLSFSFEE